MPYVRQSGVRSFLCEQGQWSLVGMILLHFVSQQTSYSDAWIPNIILWTWFVILVCTPVYSTLCAPLTSDSAWTSPCVEGQAGRPGWPDTCLGSPWGSSRRPSTIKTLDHFLIFDIFIFDTLLLLLMPGSKVMWVALSIWKVSSGLEIKVFHQYFGLLLFGLFVVYIWPDRPYILYHCCPPWL